MRIWSLPLLLLALGATVEVSAEENLISNNRHILTDEFEFYAEPPQATWSDEDKKFVVSPKSLVRSRIYLVPRIKLEGMPVLLNAQGGVLKAGDSVDTPGNKDAPGKMTALIPLSLSGRGLSRVDKRVIIAQYLNYMPKPEETPSKAADSAVTKSPASSIYRLEASRLSDIDEFVAHFSFEYLSISDLRIEARVVGMERPKLLTFDGLVPASSTFLVELPGLSKEQAQLVRAGLVSFRATCRVDMSRVAEAELRLDFSDYQNVTAEYVFREVSKLDSREEKVLFVKKRARQSISAFLDERISLMRRRAASQTVTLFSRDVASNEVDRLLNLAFPVDVGKQAMEAVIKAHESAGARGGEIDATRKALHDSYASLLRAEVAGREADPDAKRQLSDALSSLAGEGEGAEGAGSAGNKEQKLRAAIAFLEAGFYNGRSLATGEFEVRRMRKHTDESVRSDAFSIVMARSLSRPVTLSRADMREELLRLSRPYLARARRLMLLNVINPGAETRRKLSDLGGLLRIEDSEVDPLLKAAVSQSYGSVGATAD